MSDGFTLPEIETAAATLRGHIVETPTVRLADATWVDVLPAGTRAHLKLELFQQAGSFKARGAFLSVAALTPDQARAGVVAASGGNHALAVSWAAAARGISAQVVMPEATDPLRLERCRALGAKVDLAPDITAAFARMQALAETEGRTMLHPFESPTMIMGGATCGLELACAVPDADAFVLPIGGGGLAAGMSAAIRAVHPQALVFGVEPEGADTMRRSFESGCPEKIDTVRTIADSLGSPTALPQSFAVARANIDRIVTVPDAALVEGMQLYDRLAGLRVEPACAASLAGLLGPLADELSGKTIALIACGSNIGRPKWETLAG